MRRIILTIVAASALLGCGEPTKTLEFAAKSGEQSFRCGQTLTGLGTTATTYEPRDLRFYVHDVRLVDAEGGETAVTLVDDGKFQGQGVALLDFEDATGECRNGTSATNDEVRFTAPDGDYTAVRFVVGVPEALNHADASTAQAPLNFSSLFWSWQLGYKFIRLDGNTAGLPTGHNLHLGSVGCSGTPVTCTENNRLHVELTDFDLERDQVRFDLAALFAGSNLDANAPGSAPGCQSGRDDPDCGPIFERLPTAFTREAR